MQALLKKSVNSLVLRCYNASGLFPVRLTVDIMLISSFLELLRLFVVDSDLAVPTLFIPRMWGGKARDRWSETKLSAVNVKKGAKAMTVWLLYHKLSCLNQM